MSEQSHSWNVRYRAKAVAWDDGNKHFCGLITGPGPLTDARGWPSTAVVTLHPSKSDPHPDGKTTNLATDKLDAAHELWRERFLPPPAAENFWRAVHTQFGVTEKGAAVRGFLNAIAPDHEFPVDVRVILTCNEHDATPDGKGGIVQVDDTRTEIVKMGDFVTILVSRRVFEFIREKAILSGLFDKVAKWEMLVKQLANPA